jgi:hypothetical protein
MKKLIVTLALVAAGSLAYGQGTVQFSNGGFYKISTETVVAGVPDPATLAPATGAFSYGLFYGIGESTSLTLLTSQFGANSTVNTGLIASPADNATPLNTVGIPGTSGGQANVYLQVAGWSATFGTDWAAAQAASTAGTAGAYFGETPVLLGPALSPTLGPGIPIWQLASGTNPNLFHAFVMFAGAVPEPSTMALAGLGIASLLIFRRRK